MEGKEERVGGDERADMEQMDTSQPVWHAFLWSARGPYDFLVPSGQGHCSQSSCSSSAACLGPGRAGGSHRRPMHGARVALQWRGHLEPRCFTFAHVYRHVGVKVTSRGLGWEALSQED